MDRINSSFSLLPSLFLLVLLALLNASFAQSPLTDDAHVNRSFKG